MKTGSRLFLTTMTLLLLVFLVCRPPAALGLMLQMKTTAAPITIKSVVSKLTQSCQRALEDKCSRMEVELPPAVDWGVEMKKPTAATSPISSSSSSSSRPGSPAPGGLERTKKSNREAARLFVEMFSALQSTTCVLFPTELEAAEVRSNPAWRTFKGACLSMEAGKDKAGYGKLRSRRFSAEEQEAVLMGNDGVYIPDGVEVLIVAGPRAKDYKHIKRACERLGDGVCIIVLNGRIDAVKAATRKSQTGEAEAKGEGRGDDKGADKSEGAEAEGREEGSEGKLDWYDSTFTSVFHYAPPATSLARELLLYHEYKGEWSVSEKQAPAALGGKEPSLLDKIGSAVRQESPFVVLWRGEARPSAADVAAL